MDAELGRRGGGESGSVCAKHRVTWHRLLAEESEAREGGGLSTSSREESAHLSPSVWPRAQGVPSMRC